MTEAAAELRPPLTTRTRVALAIARALAAAYGYENLSSAHVLLGILREGENPAVAVLAHAGVALTDLRHVLEQSLVPRGRVDSRDLVLPLTNGEQELLARADRERRQRDDDPLGTEHLLLAMLRDRGSDIGTILAHHGLTHDSAAPHIAAVVHYHTKPSAPSTG